MKDNIPYYLKVTPLYDLEEKLGGKFVEFSGYYMPVNYEAGIVREHEAVRLDSGFFDISHMGNIMIEGENAQDLLNYVGSNNILKIGKGHMQYQMFLNESGGVIDDMMAYKFEDSKLMVVANAINTDRVLARLEEFKDKFKVSITLLDYAAIALQGPNSLKYLETALDTKLDLKPLEFFKLNGYIISRSGYTGEDGFEIYGQAKKIISLVQKLVDQKVTPCGLGSRDTLRFEAGLPLYGHELAEFITPLEAGMKFAVDFNKDDFIGKEALLKQKDHLEHKIFGLELLERGIARQGYSVYFGEKAIGFVTSGFMIPGKKESYANAYLENNYKLGDIVEIEIRNKRVKAKIRSKKYLKK